MNNTCIIGYGMVGKATALSFGIQKYISRTDSNITLQEAVNCDTIFLCLPTPTIDNKCDISLIEEYIQKLTIMGSKSLFVIRSTVMPGTARYLSYKYKVPVVSNPEFLTESTWENDALHPVMVVIGSDDQVYGDKLRALYEGRWKGIQIYQTDTITAELIKYTMNTFFATKVVFANAIYDICQDMKANYETVKNVIQFHPWGSKNHFNIWHKGGRGAAGKCLYKDLDAFSHVMGSKFLQTVYDINLNLLKEFPKKG